jgi:CRP-like cAMP-binding protein
MSIYLEIPHEEFNVFREFIKTYTLGEDLITEGDTLDHSLFLIRVGTVGIYRQILDKQEQISTVSAVNFVGEMELILGGARIATVKALTEEVLAYRFTRADVNTIIKTPTWAETLLTRLTLDLKALSDRCVTLEVDSMLLQARVDGLTQQLSACQKRRERLR